MMLSFGVLAPWFGVGVDACSTRYDNCEFMRTCPGPGLRGPGAGGGSATGGTGFGGRPLIDLGGASGAYDPAPNQAGEGGLGEGGAAAHPGEAGAADRSEGGAGADTTPPEIVGVSPADAAVGVRADTDIVIRFSERMDRAETEHAFASEDFSASELTFVWNASGTVLTVELAERLTYRPIASPTPVVYHFSITDAARDRAGNHLSGTHDYSFETAELAQTALPPSDIRHIEHPVVGDDAVVAYCSASMPSIAPEAGILFSFSLQQLSQLDKIVELTQAELSVQSGQTGGVLADQLRADSVSVVPFELTWDVPVLASLGPFEAVPDSSDSAIQLDVQSAAADDLAHRDTRMSLSQYLVRNRDDASDYSANLQCKSALLLLTYAVSPE